MQPYRTYREFARDVLIAIGLFLIAAQFAAWTTPWLERAPIFVDAYLLAFAIGMIPFAMFLYYAKVSDVDFIDVCVLVVLVPLVHGALSLFPSLEALGMPAVVGVALVCFNAYRFGRRRLMSPQSAVVAKE
jgi:hypothetical protein